MKVNGKQGSLHCFGCAKIIDGRTDLWVDWRTGGLSPQPAGT